VRDLRQADGHCCALAGGPVVSALKKRVEVLEASSGGEGGCRRCRRLLTIVRRAITGEFHSARWNGEAISEEERAELEVEKECPRCGRSLDDWAVIKLGGRPEPRF
jgi:hypothetical protein